MKAAAWVFLGLLCLVIVVYVMGPWVLIPIIFLTLLGFVEKIFEWIGNKFL